MTALLTPARAARKRLLTVGHSFVRRANRLLPEAIKRASNGEWDVSVAAPSYYEGNPRFGDLTPESLVVGGDETVDVVGVPVMLSRRVHVALYGPALRGVMQSGFDAVHCWEEPFVLSCSQMARWAPRTAVLTVQTWQNIDKKYPPPFNWLERQVMARADGWIGGATLVEQALRERPGYRERPHRVMGFGVDAAHFRPQPAAAAQLRAQFGWADDGIHVIGYFGRFTEEKGLRLLMRVLDRLQSPWRALFVGGGLLDRDVRRWAERYGTNVKVIASVAHDDVPRYLGALDMLCVPSQTTATWREQFGRVLIEAFACGVCVVASDSGEIPHVVGDAGAIVSERDEEGWRLTLEGLLRDNVMRRDLAARGLHRAREHYTWSAIGAKYLEFITALERSRTALAKAGR